MELTVPSRPPSMHGSTEGSEAYAMDNPMHGAIDAMEKRMRTSIAANNVDAGGRRRRSIAIATHTTHTPNTVNLAVDLVDSPSFGSRLEQLTRSANILLEDVALEQASDRIGHNTQLFRRTCIWSLAYLVFSVVLGVTVFAYFFTESNLVRTASSTQTCT